MIDIPHSDLPAIDLYEEVLPKHPLGVDDQGYQKNR